MIVQIVLVIVTAVQVNSQQLCPSVCQCESEQATCTDLFSGVADTTQHRFHAALRELRVYGTTNLELGEDRFLRWNITSLAYLDLSHNNIVKIWQRAFYSLAYLENLYLYGNSITTLHYQTFYYNTHLVWLSLAKNSITDINPSIFQKNIRLRHLDVSENKIKSINPDIFNYNIELEWLDFGSNVITHINPTTLRNASKLRDLNISGNEITAIVPETFSANVELQSLNLNDNNISDIHPSTFRNNRKLRGLHISGNKLASIKPATFDHNWDLLQLNLERNCITDINPSTFQRNSKLTHLDISRNKITSVNPYTFIHNKELTFLYLGSNVISEMTNLSLRGLEKLQNLDLSNNNIEELKPVVLHSFSASKNRQSHQVSKLKHLNLAENKIRSFNFELYFPSSRNSDTSTPTFQLVSLNVSSNHLTTLDLTSAKWLHHTTVRTDLSGNPWNCDCSVLLDVWRELQHKMTLNCASPELLRGHTWDVIGTLCLDRITFLDPPDSNKQNVSSDATTNITTDAGHALNTAVLFSLDNDNPNLMTTIVNRSSAREVKDAEDFRESENQKTNISRISHSFSDSYNQTTQTLLSNDSNGSFSQMTTISTVTGVLSGCILIAGGMVLVVLVKTLRDGSNAPQYSKVYAPGSSYQQVRNTSFTEDYATDHIYETVQ
jgi:Leucine-rich repeat (LRR) protein